MKFLIVDDSKAMRHIFARNLKKAGYEGHSIIQACSAKEAENIIWAQDPDIVFLDINMPEMTGLELVTRLRAAGREIVFGICSAERNPRVLEEAVELGAQFLLSKPFTAEQIQTAVEPLLQALQRKAEGHD